MIRIKLQRISRYVITVALVVGLAGCSTPAQNGMGDKKPANKPDASSASSQKPNNKTAGTSQQAAQRPTAKVIETVDGDTIKIEVNGRVETVRMLLVDTPETKHPTKPVQPFGPEASKFTKELLTGKQVELEKDVSERDKYGRLLFYVYVDGKSVEEMLLEKGLARVAVFPPDVKYVDKYREIQDKARKAKLGIWSIENYTSDTGYTDQPVASGSGSAAVTGAAQAAGLRFDPNGPDRDCSDFSNQAEAQAFYLAAGGPAKDPHRLDPDKDGIACEDK